MLVEFAGDERSDEVKSFIQEFITHVQVRKSLKGKNYKFKKKKAKNPDYDFTGGNGKEKYAKYLESDLWKSIRKRVLDQYNSVCEGCKSTKNIQVHHTVYNEKILSGESLLGLRVVCKTCHETIHKRQKQEVISLKKATNLVIGRRWKNPTRKKKVVIKIDPSSELESLKKMAKNIKR